MNDGYYKTAADLEPAEAQSATRMRKLIREGRFRGHTSGLGADSVQGNLVILPASYALAFATFCQRNPKPCPVLEISDPGSPRLPSLGADIDIRTDVPLYRVFRYGELIEEVTDIRALWEEDFVAFVLGCSFSFERALIEAGIPLRHVAEGKNVAMYRTSWDTHPAGVFSGKLVVSMRPMRPSDAVKAAVITSRFERVHGKPVHIGDPDVLGIADLSRPDYGDAVRVEPDEVPVYHACGVSPVAAIERAKLPLVITHAPGSMLITDLRNHELAS